LAWLGLIEAIARPMDKRRYELATIGASRQLRSSYCSLAHGKILTDDFLEPDVVRQIIEDRESALDEVGSAVVDLASKVADDATSIAETDIERLRSLGLTDRDIFDVVLAAAARSFFSKVLDATSTLPDRIYNELEPELRAALTVGRPIEGD
jgi:alkylhydroperoxidase family enzyme